MPLVPAPKPEPGQPDWLPSVEPLRRPDKPNDLWAWAKQIDGYPDTEWTFPVFLARIAVLDRLLPQQFYEYGSEYDQVLSLLVRADRLLERGVPEPATDTVTLGVQWFDSGFRPRDGWLGLPGPEEPFRGRHSVRLVGWADEGATLVFQNSWGDWGDRGVGYMPREYFEAHVEDVFVQRLASVGPSPHMNRALPRPADQLTAEEEATAWMTRNPETETEVLVRDIRHTLARFVTYSVQTQQVVEVFELRNAFRPVARCHVFHLFDAERPRSLVEELFVLPRFRLRGYGRFLEQVAVDAAAAAGSQGVDIIVYKADHLPRTRSNARGFISALGYEWEDESLRRPNRVGRGRKNL